VIVGVNAHVIERDAKARGEREDRFASRLVARHGAAGLDERFAAWPRRT